MAKHRDQTPCDEPPDPALELQLLGTPQLHADPQSPHRLPFKDAALLARLAIDGPQPRSRLAPWLWPQATPEGARVNLRQRVSRLHRAWGRRLLLIEGQDRLALAPSVRVDVHQLRQALEVDAQAARGELLEGWLPEDSLSTAEASLGTWLVQARDTVRLHRRRVLVERMRALQAPSPLQALAYAQRLVDLEPGQDEPLCHLLQLHHVLGERAAAQSAWQRDVRFRQRESLSPPGPEAQALFRLVEHAAPLPVADDEALPSRASIAALLRPPRLVGRSPEWTAMTTAWAAGRTVLVVGHAGVGKTRLVEAFAKGQGVGLRLAPRPGDRSVPYALLGQLVEAMAPRRQDLEGWVRAELARLWPPLGEPPGGPLQPLRLLQALRVLLQGSGPVLVDDLHFADAASAELLPAVIDALPQALLSTRPDPIAPPLAAWVNAGDDRVTQVTLSPWTAQGVDELLTLLELPGLDAARWTRPLMRHTGGHALLLLGTLQVLLRSPLPDPTRRLPVPDDLPALITPRLLQLPPLAMELARLAAFAGESFGVDLARACFSGDAARLSAAWRELDQAGLLGDGNRMHDLVAEAVRQQTAEPDAQHAHRQLASALSSRGAAPGRLAILWTRAEAYREAAQCHEQAALEAERRSRRAEEAAQWELAEAAWARAAEPEKAFDAGIQRARVLLVSGDLATAAPHIERLRAGAGSMRQQSQALSTQAHAALLEGRFEEAAGLADEASRLASGVDVAVHRDADLLAATAAAQLGRLPLALQRLDAVDRNDEAHPPRPVHRLAALAMRGHVLDRVGRCLDALAVTDRAIALATTLDEQTELIILLGNAATLHAKSAQVPLALAQARRALALAERLGQHNGLQGVSLRMNLAVMAAAAGEYRSAVSELASALSLMQQQGLVAYLAYGEHHQAMLWMMLGQPARAMRLLSQPVHDVPNTVRVRRLSLRGRLQRLCGVTVPGDDWRQFEIDASVDPQVAENARLERARTLEPEAALRVAEEVEARAESLGLLSAALHARLVKLDSSIRRGATGEAADRARALMAELVHRHPTDVYWPELPWVAHRALAAAGCDGEADAALQAAQGWLQRALNDEVDEVFRSGFCSRNHVNRAVLRALQRRGRPEATGPDRIG